VSGPNLPTLLTIRDGDPCVSDGDAAARVAQFHAASSLGWSGPARRVTGLGPRRRPGEPSWRPPSVRDFQSSGPGADEILPALRRAYGTPGQHRPVPSAGAIYGLALVGIERVTGETVAWPQMADAPSRPTDVAAVDAVVFHQIRGSAWIVVVTAAVGAYLERYGCRGYRYALIEAGHLGQELLSVFSALNMRSCPLGAFDDRGLTRLVGTELADVIPLYIVAVGYATAAPIPGAMP
jgi:nitroreductase